MKKLLFIFIYCFATCNYAYSSEPCDTLIITGHPAYPPVAWALGNQIIGASPKMVEQIAKELKVKKVSSVNFGTREKAQEAIKEGRADVIFGIYQDQTRKTYMHYIEPPYMLDPVSIVIRKGEALPFTQWSDLQNKKGVTNLGESYGTQFDAYMKEKLTVARSDGVDKAFAQLLNKQADYLIIGRYPGKMEAQKLNILAKIEFLPKNVLTADMFVAFSKKSKCYASLEAGFSKAIAKTVKTGEVDVLLEAANKQFYQ